MWLCMEVMDTSLDKFYKMVYDNAHKIPEDVLGKIAVAVSILGLFSFFITMKNKYPFILEF